MNARLTPKEYWDLPIIPENKFIINDLYIDVFCTYNEDENRLYLYYEQSIEGLDWLLNFYASSTEFPLNKGYIKVHDGFSIVTLRTIPHIEELLSKYHCKNMTITGYSHGGAPAELCHLYFKNKYPDLNIDTCVFGAARFLKKDEDNPEYHKALEMCKDIVNVQCKSDIVTHVPPKIFKYVDTGSIVHVGSNNNLLHELWIFLTLRPFKSGHASYRYREYGRMNYKGNRDGTCYM